MKKKFLYWYDTAFWAINRVFVYFYLRSKFNIKVDKMADPMPQAPFIMVANHGTFFDPWIIGHFSKSPLSIMINEDAYKASPFTRWYLRNIGTFPKRKGSHDFKAMKITLKRLANKYAVIIFPEGQTTWDGETQPVYSGIEKIIKKANVSLVLFNLKGNFLSKPWWATSFRKGSLRISRKVLSSEQLQGMEPQQILDTMINYIRQNDIKDIDNEASGFSGKNLSNGLKRFIWICRTCNKEDSILTKGNTVSCASCGSSWTIDALLKFTKNNSIAKDIGDLHDWVSWHKKSVKKTISIKSGNSPLAQSNKAQLCKISDTGKICVTAEGTLILTKEKFTFTHNKFGFSTPVSDIVDYIFQRQDLFECRSRNSSWIFRFGDTSLMKWVFYFRYLNTWEMFEERGYI